MERPSCFFFSCGLGQRLGHGRSSGGAHCRPQLRSGVCPSGVHSCLPLAGGCLQLGIQLLLRLLHLHLLAEEVGSVLFSLPYEGCQRGPGLWVFKMHQGVFLDEG